MGNIVYWLYWVF